MTIRRRKPAGVLARVAEHRGWIIVQTYEDQGISGAKGRDQRPAFDQMLKDIVRRKFDWSFDRLDANHGFGGYLDDRYNDCVCWAD